MCVVKDFSLTYNVLNDKGTVSPGDTLTGTVCFTLRRPTKVKSLYVKATGDARAQWTEGSGDDNSTYSAQRRYFKVKEYIIGEKVEDDALPKGAHCFQFKIKIPQRHMPSSFMGSLGSIAYILTAKMTRSWWIPSEAKQRLNFVSNFIPKTDQLHRGVLLEKEIGIFSRGQVRMLVTIDRNVFTPGETVVVHAKITNSSSKTMTPIVSLMQRAVLFAQGHRKISERSVCNLKGSLISPQSEEAVCYPMKTPHSLAKTIHDCDILSVDYYFKVVLDIRFCFDLRVNLPVVLIPACFTNNVTPGGAVGPCAAEAQSERGDPHPYASAEPYPLLSGLGVYGDPVLNELPHLLRSSDPAHVFLRWAR